MIIVVFWILFGMLIGWIASIIDESGPRQHIVTTNMALGVSGSIIGGLTGRALEESTYMFGNIGMLLAIIGGTATILAARTLHKGRTD